MTGPQERVEGHIYRKDPFIPTHTEVLGRLGNGPREKDLDPERASHSL